MIAKWVRAPNFDIYPTLPPRASRLTAHYYFLCMAPYPFLKSTHTHTRCPGSVAVGLRDSLLILLEPLKLPLWVISFNWIQLACFHPIFFSCWWLLQNVPKSNLSWRSKPSNLSWRSKPSMRTMEVQIFHARHGGPSLPCTPWMSKPSHASQTPKITVHESAQTQAARAHGRDPCHQASCHGEPKAV